MSTNRRNFLKKTIGASAMIGVAPFMSLAYGSEKSSSVIAKKQVFLTKPYLQNPTESSISVMWLVNLPSYSYVEFGETKELGQMARTVNDGLVMANNRLNKITIKDLKPGTEYFYRVVSKQIKKFNPYNIVYGATIYSETYRFSTLSGKKEDVSILIFNDLHNRPESIAHLLNLVDKNSADFVFFNGDILSHIDSEKQIINNLLKVCSEEFASETPFYFVRGNHETRGEFARDLHKYFANPQGKQYYDFVWGATHFTVIDSGEDKPDDAEVYAGIVDFDDYRKEQQAWFKKVAQSSAFKNAKFRVVLTHIPIYHSDDWHGTTHMRNLFADIFNEAKIDICINGHKHESGIFEPVPGKHNYPIIIGGGPKNGIRTIINLKADRHKLTVDMIGDDGQLLGTYALDAK